MRWRFLMRSGFESPGSTFENRVSPTESRVPRLASDRRNVTIASLASNRPMRLRLGVLRIPTACIVARRRL